jgi:hypothetical protein
VNINISTLRQLWSVVAETQPHRLLKLDDADLVKQLMLQLQNRQPLNHEETQAMKIYLNTKLSLIRDIAQA